MPTVTDLIRYEEGYREDPYYCSEGYPTIGYGFKLGPQGAPLEMYEFTCPPLVAHSWLQVTLDRIRELVVTNHKPANFIELNRARQAVILSMCYQLGINGFYQFKNAIAAMEQENWEKAAEEMLDSVWYVQTPHRALRHAEQMETGEWCPLY